MLLLAVRSAALLLAGGQLAEEASRRAPRAAHPTRVPIESGASVRFNGEPDRALTARAAALATSAAVRVAIARRYAPHEIARAHADLAAHHAGKLVLDTSQLRW